jgi:hypothetical protein
MFFWIAHKKNINNEYLNIIICDSYRIWSDDYVTKKKLLSQIRH